MSEQFVLFDVDVDFVVRNVIRRSGIKLRFHDEEDLAQFLRSTAWELSLSFDPKRGVQFAPWLTITLRRRLVDWQRSQFRTRWQFGDGRVYERPRPQFVSLDADDFERDRLEQTLGGRSMASDSHRLAAELRSLDARACRPAGRNDWLGDEAA